MASHVIVTAGSEMAGSLIAAGAVMTGKIPADILAGGMPPVLKEISDEG